MASGSDTATITVNVTANEYSVASKAEIDTAVADAVTTAASNAISIKIRDVAISGLIDIKNRAYTNPVTISSDTLLGADASQFILDNSSNVIIDGLDFYYEGVSNSKMIRVSNGASNCTIQNNRFNSATIDPAGDYTSAIPARPDAIGGQGGTSPADITIINNEVSNCDIGINLGCTGDYVVSGNYVHDCFEDMIKLGAPTGNTSITCEDNVLVGTIAAGTDFGNPHSDYIQCLGNSAQDLNISIQRNIMIDVHARSASQNIFLDDMGVGFYYVAEVRGNVVYSFGPNAASIRIRQAKNCQVTGNTAVSGVASPASASTITIGDDTSTGSHICDKNVADAFNVVDTTSTNNVTLGKAGATISYATAFDGPTFTGLTTAAQIKSAFSRKASGPLDLTPYDVGAVGSGYVTWATTIPGNNGSIDTEFHPSTYSQNLVDTQGTGRFTATLASLGLSASDDSAFLTFAMTAEFASDAATDRIYKLNGRTEFLRTTDKIKFTIKSTSNSVLFEATTPSITAASGLRHIVLSADLTGPTIEEPSRVPVVNVYLDGVGYYGEFDRGHFTNNGDYRSFKSYIRFLRE